MTFDELEVGQWYYFTHDGEPDYGEWRGDGLFVRNLKSYDIDDCKDITRVPSEEEWQRAVAIEKAAKAFLCERNAIVYVPEVLMDALRTALALEKEGK